MMRLPSGFHFAMPDLSRVGAGCAFLNAGVICVLCIAGATRLHAQNPPTAPVHEYFVDCSAAQAGDGSMARPWNTLAAAETHPFAPGDRIEFKRGTICKGAFAPQGSGTADHIIRLTAYGVGARPKIVAPSTARQAFLLFNQEYWQVDSLDISGGNTYGVFVTGDTGTLHHLYLKNLYVHSVYGGAFKNKDNGLVVVGPSSMNVFFEDVLIDGVDAAHTNQWAGILVGGGSFPYRDDARRNHNVHIRNSTVHDVYGDGIVLFRDEDGSITDSAAWLTGMQPTETVGTPNAIWTWTCLRCSVSNNEAYLTDSPGVDGGAYDIDWDDQFNTVENNYAHDTQGYCIAVFAAGYVTSDSKVENNLCVDNGLSPRLAVLQGVIYLHTWNGGVIHNLAMSGNGVEWDPPVFGTAVMENDAAVSGKPILNALSWHWLLPQPEHVTSLRIEATVDPVLDGDGLLSSQVRAGLIVLRSLASEYGPGRLRVVVHIPVDTRGDPEENALLDMEGVDPAALDFERDGSVIFKVNQIRILGADGTPVEPPTQGFENAATLGGAVRELLGPPDYSHPLPPYAAHHSAPNSAEAPQ
jgi:hypothetical protein